MVWAQLVDCLADGVVGELVRGEESEVSKVVMMVMVMGMGMFDGYGVGWMMLT